MSCPCTVIIQHSTTEIVRGDTAIWIMCFKFEDEPVDITGWEIHLIIRDLLAPEDAMFSRHIIHTIPASEEATAGTATIAISARDTAEFPAGKYYYEFKRVITTVEPPDVWTFKRSDRPEFEVKNGTALYTYSDG